MARINPKRKGLWYLGGEIPSPQSPELVAPRTRAPVGRAVPCTPHLQPSQSALPRRRTGNFFSPWRCKGAEYSDFSRSLASQASEGELRLHLQTPGPRRKNGGQDKLVRLQSGNREKSKRQEDGFNEFDGARPVRPWVFYGAGSTTD